MDQAGFDAYQKAQGGDAGAGANADAGAQGNYQQQQQGATQVQDVLDALSGKGTQGGDDGANAEQGNGDDKGKEAGSGAQGAGEGGDEDIDMFEQEEEAGDEGGEGKEGDDGISEEDDKVVSPIVKKALAPIKAQLQKERRENAVNSFFQTEEGQQFKQFEGQIRKFAFDKKLSGMKVRFIAYAVAGPKLAQIAGQKGVEAYKQAKGAMVQGNQSRPQSGNVTESTIANMPKDQFRQLWGKVRNTPRT